MALVDSRVQRSSMLCAMYFAQGVPWGFMVTALAAYLASRGVSDADLGSLTGIVLIPWTFNHTDHSVGTTWITADCAGVLICQVKTDRTELNLFFDLNQAVGKTLSQLFIGPQHIECDPGCGLLSNSREPGKLLYKPF